MLASGPILGIAAGLAMRGSLARLADIRIRWWPVLAAAIAVRLFAGQIGAVAPLLYVLAFAGIVLVAALNRGTRGMVLVAAGAALNLLVVAINGGMPVDPAAVGVAGTRMPDDALHISMTERTALPLLADWIPLAVYRSVYSPGDLLLAAGGFWIPFAAMRAR